MALEELQDDRYRLVRSLGSGGRGEVYLMQDMRINRQVAIKVIRSKGAHYPDSATAREAAHLFQREARAIAALEHPNILPLYDFGEEIRDGTTITYMVMPFCTEGSLASWLRQRNSAAILSLQDVAYLVEEAADALQYAHDHNVMHLDVKASNFLLRSNEKHPSRPTLLLADFGIARSNVTVASSSRTIRGTPTSMAPEQWSGSPVPATDQYALAVITYEMLVGRTPFVGSMEQVMYQHFSVQPSPPGAFNPQLSTAIDSVILRALAKKPEDRFPSIAGFAGAFEQAVQASPNALVGPQQSDASDFRATLAISQVEAQSGTSRIITLPGGKHVNVTIPAGVSAGHVIRLHDLGEATPVLLTIAIKQPKDSQRPSDVRSAKQLPATLNSNVRQPFDSVSDHDFPTPPSSDPHLQAPERQSIPYVPESRPVRRSRMAGVISGLIILVILILLAVGGYFFYRSRQANVNSSALTQTTAAAGKLQTPTHTSSVTITATATQQNGLYIAGTYNGSMFDQTTQQTTEISVLLVQTQGNAALRGTFTFMSPTQRAYPLTGTVDTQGNFSFRVQQHTNQLPLFFHGQVYQGVYLKGNFCSSNTNSCSTDTGYFTVGPKF